MNFLSAILNFLRPNNQLTTTAPEVHCPNCWGREEYDGQSYQRFQRLDITKNSNKTLGWINAYANKHLSGIARNRQGNGQEVVCAKCVTSYQQINQ